MRQALTFVLITLCSQFYGQGINLRRLNITPGASDYAIVDMNNDNLPDIVGIGQFWDVELYMNKGDFRFSYVDIGADQGIKMQFSSQIGFIDMDKDGDRDIIHNCPNCGTGSEVIIYNNENNNKYTKKWIVATNAGISTIYDVFDINKDGREDLVVFGDKANVYINKDGNSFNSAMALNPNLVYNYVNHQDVNGDGKIDLIAKSATDFYVFVNNGNGFANGLKLTGQNLVGRIRSKDINKDGVKDYYCTNNNCLKALISNKSNTDFFDNVSNVLCTSSADSQFDLLDMDGDADLDIVHGKTSGEGIYYKKLNGTNYESSLLVDHIGYQHQVYLTADFNNDGKEDVMFSDKFSILAILENKGDPKDMPLHVIGDVTRDYKIGDMDKDIQDDIVSFRDEWIGINRIKSSEFKPLETIFRTGEKTTINAIGIMDVDNDKDNDIVVVVEPDPVLGQKPTLFWLQNDNNVFTKSNTILTNKRDLASIAIHDFDKDGFSDIVAMKTGGTGFLLKNNGNGTFISKDFNGLGAKNLIVDLNRDGFTDLLTWRSNGDHVYFMENDKAGNFKTRVKLASYQIIHDVLALDVDNDNDLDIVVTCVNSSESVMMVHYNNNMQYTTVKNITKNFPGTSLEYGFKAGSSLPSIISGGYLDTYTFTSNGDVSFETGYTPLYTYSNLKRININNTAKLMAYGGENNDYLIEIDGFNFTKTTPTIDLVNSEFELYPNPSSDWVYTNLENNVVIKIYDVMGSLVTTKFGRDFNIVELKSGIYILKSSNGKNAVINKN